MKQAILALVLTVTVAVPMLSPPSAHANPAVPPPECVTKTSIQPLNVPAWAFVMNFDVIRTRTNNAQYPVGCIIVWRVPIFPSDYISIDTCDAFGPVTFGGGQATFTGGDIRCTVNVQQSLGALTPTIAITNEQFYPLFQLVGVGDPDPPTTPHPYSNPVVHYQPNAAGALPVGLFVPALAINDVYVIQSLFNNITNVGTVGFPSGLGPQTWSAKHAPLGQNYQVVHERNWNVQDIFMPRPPVNLRVDGATIFVGGSPLGPGFDGNLDEAIVDPVDRSGPTAGFVVHLPVVSR